MSDNLVEQGDSERKTLQEELEGLWEKKDVWIEGVSISGPSPDFSLPEGMRLIPVSGTCTVLRSKMPGLPEAIPDVPIAVFFGGGHPNAEEIQEVAMKILNGIQSGKIKFNVKILEGIS